MRVLLALTLLCGQTVWAQMIPEREVEIIHALYEAGKYADAAERANQSLGLGNFTAAQRGELHQLAGLSAFHLGDVKAAQAAFMQVLRLNPDAVLDPFAVPPAAIKVFEQVRKDNTELLNAARQQIILQLEQEKRSVAERERAEREERERAQMRQAATDEITVRTVEKRLFVLNLVPFGAGQFQQGRRNWGIAFAVSEGLMALVSIVSFFAIEGLYRDVTYSLPDRLTSSGEVFTFTARTIPQGQHLNYEVWSALKWATGFAFYGLWAVGIGDALWHHQETSTTETKVKPAAPQARLKLYPTQGGIGAGLTVNF